jgi:addiction module HigA family antidote
MIRIPTHRPPTHPGEMLLEEFLIPMDLTQRALARAIHVPYRAINALVNQRRDVTPGIALRLSKFFGVSADFWMNLQLRWDLYYAQQAEIPVLATIQTFTNRQDRTIKEQSTQIAVKV